MIVGLTFTIIKTIDVELFPNQILPDQIYKITLVNLLDRIQCKLDNMNGHSLLVHERTNYRLGTRMNSLSKL